MSQAVWLMVRLNKIIVLSLLTISLSGCASIAIHAATAVGGYVVKHSIKKEIEKKKKKDKNQEQEQEQE